MCQCLFVCVPECMCVCAMALCPPERPSKPRKKKRVCLSYNGYLVNRRAGKHAIEPFSQPASHRTSEQSKCVCMWRHKLKKSHFYPFILFWRDNKNMLLVLQAHTHRHKHTHAHLHCHSLRGCHSLCICGMNVCWLDCVP